MVTPRAFGACERNLTKRSSRFFPAKKLLKIVCKLSLLRVLLASRDFHLKGNTKPWTPKPTKLHTQSAKNTAIDLKRLRPMQACTLAPIVEIVTTIDLLPTLGRVCVTPTTMSWLRNLDCEEKVYEQIYRVYSGWYRCL